MSKFQGEMPSEKYFLDTATTNITSAAWVTIVASMGFGSSQVEIFNGTGRLLRIASGSAGQEVEYAYYIVPGGSVSVIPFSAAKGIRISLKAVTTTAAAGLIVLNFFR